MVLTQADCSSRDSRLSLLSAYCLCGWRCRQRLYATAGDSEFCPPCIGSAKVLTFFFVFYGHLVPKKKKRNENADVFYGRKMKRRKIKKCVFWRRKIKRKRNSVGLSALIVSGCRLFQLFNFYADCCMLFTVSHFFCVVTAHFSLVTRRLTVEKKSTSWRDF